MAGRHVARREGREAARRDKRIIETSEYTAALERQILALAARVAQDPAGLTAYKRLEDALRDSHNLAVFGANHQDPAPYSMRELARIEGVSAPAILKRERQGRQLWAALEALRAAGRPVIRLADIRAARAARMAEAGLDDRTGSALERGTEHG